MLLSFACVRTALRVVRSTYADLAADQRGNIAILTALLMPVLVGATSLGVEGSYWYLTQRKMQNAADSAVVTAATVGGLNYDATTLVRADTEAKAVAAAYGFKHGVNGVSVITSNNETCPSGSATPKCYSVRIAGHVPVFMAQIVGYNGSGNGPTITDAKSSRRQALSAISLARPVPSPRDYCILALGSSGVSFRTNGAPNADLSGCNVMSNGDATCNGHNLKADHGDAAGTNNGCGVVQQSNLSPVADSYRKLWETSADSLLKNNPCGGIYPQVPEKNNDPDLPPKNQWQAGVQQNLSGVAPTPICGDLQLTGSKGGTVVVHTPPEGAVLVIWNGSLDTNGLTLKTDNGSALTIIFAGTNDSQYDHAPIGGGTLDITAPTSGPWKGIAIYQAPNLTTGVDISAAGNSPTWNITGLVYLPNASVTFSGAVNKSSYGETCFGMVVKDITVNGTGSIMEHGSCEAAGVDLPTGSGGVVRGQIAG